MLTYLCSQIVSLEIRIPNRWITTEYENELIENFEYGSETTQDKYQGNAEHYLNV